VILAPASRLVLRGLHHGDLAAAQRLSAAMSWPHRLEDWRLLRLLGQGLAACNSAGELVGTIMWWKFGASAHTLGMVLVASTQQGMGIGRRLMQAALEQVGPRALMLNATTAGLALYQKLGFHPVGLVSQHQGVLATAPQAGGTRAARTDDRAAVLALDARAFGAPRAALLDRLLREGACEVVEAAGRVSGFAIRRRFGRGEVIGPVVAVDEADAIALVAASLRPGFQRIDIVTEATALAAWLSRAGLPRVDTATTMTRGDWPAGAGTVRRLALANQAQG
jgi:GNAT superfamily N-acetyltransferase